jgi:hypothetical protein
VYTSSGEHPFAAKHESASRRFLDLVIFVTARAITPAGLAFDNEEKEENACYRLHYAKSQRTK